MKNVAFLFCFFILTIGISQPTERIQITGKVLDAATKSPLPYVKIYNKTTKIGTISNQEGYFKIEALTSSDSIYVSFIGYKKKALNVANFNDFQTIYLEEEGLLLSEVVVQPSDNAYLISLIQTCRKKAPKKSTTAKAYYELKSFDQNKQIELVEAFYNVDLSGYDIENLNLKAGRLAVQNSHNRYFVSMSSSLAITQLQLIEKNKFFPTSPFELSSKSLKENYYLHLKNKYLNETNDSIYLIEFTPKKDSTRFYTGNVWINKSQNQVVKITLNCENCQVHPFLPLFPLDSIARVDFKITKTFSENNQNLFFNHIDFDYTIAYVSRLGKTEEMRYTIETKAVLFAYNYQKTFDLPHFDFPTFEIADYRKINAFPYNPYFWEMANNESRLVDQLDQNQRFFEDTNSLNNKTIFKSIPNDRRGIFEHPYKAWSENRIIFKEILDDTLAQTTAPTVIAEKYNLSVQIFVDINRYNDSTHILTTTVFDPYQSYYHLPIDQVTHCFLNIYFDICEIERRKLAAQLAQIKNDEAGLKATYEAFLINYQNVQTTYLKAVDRGTNRLELEKWNEYVKTELKIDNIALFQPYP
jgi:hypothetical protein